MSIKRFLIEGAQSVGKTTLINELPNLFNDYSVTPVAEVARNLIKHGITHDTETKHTDYYAYFSEHLKNFNTYNSDIVLFDRSVLDVIAFARINLGKGSWVEKLGFEIATLIKPEISGILYIPIEFPVVSDGIRNTDEQTRRQFDSVLLDVINELGISHTIVSGSPNVRLKFAETAIRAAIPAN